MEELIKGSLEGSGQKYVYSALSRYEARIRFALKLISMMKTISFRIERLNDRIQKSIESSMLNTKRFHAMIDDYESDKNMIVQNLYHWNDQVVALLADNTQDRAYLDRLKDIEDEIGVNSDISTDAEKLKSIVNIIDIVKGGS